MSSTMYFEYPLGSGNYLSVPPQVLNQIGSGYRISLAQNMTFDISNGYDIWTDHGWAAPYQLLEKPDNPKMLVLDEASYAHTVDPIEDYIGPISISVRQLRRFQVLKVDPITDFLIQLNIPFGNFATRTTPVAVYVCALLQDPCGVKYVLPITVV